VQAVVGAELHVCDQQIGRGSCVSRRLATSKSATIVVSPARAQPGVDLYLLAAIARDDQGSPHAGHEKTARGDLRKDHIHEAAACDAELCKGIAERQTTMSPPRDPPSNRTKTVISCVRQMPDMAIRSAELAR
jgi:hypothetical protein